MAARTLCILIASGVLLSGFVLWQTTRAWWIRALVGALSAYGAAAFVHAAVTGLALRAVLAGGGLFSSAPQLLQGALVGAVVVLPWGWIVSMLQLGIPQLRAGSRRRAVSRAIALTLAVAIVAVDLPRVSARQTTADRSMAERLAVLERSVRAISDGDRSSPRDHWDPAYVADTVGHQPDALFDWVRAKTRWIPYRGFLRGPIGVLMDRDGNSLDRSVLLATLFQRAGYTSRLAHAELSPAMATDLIELLVSTASPRHAIMSARSETPATTTSLPDGAAAVRTLTAQYQLDGAAVVQRIGESAGGLDHLRADLYRRSTEQTGRLLSAVVRSEATGDLERRRTQAVLAVRDHWWAQLQRNGQWVDCDLLAGGRMGQSLVAAAETVSLDDLPRELRQEVVIRVVAEHQSRNGRQEERVLEHVVTPADSAGRAYVLQLWPTAWPSQIARTIDGRFGVKATALEQHQWTAVLTLDGGDSFAHGVLGEAPGPSGTSALNGIAAAFSSQFSTPTPGSVLTAVWIEYEVRAGGGELRTTRRAIFQLSDAARRQPATTGAPKLGETDRLTRSLALMSQTEILVLGSHLAPEWIAHLASASAASAYPLIRSLAAPDASLGRDQLVGELAKARRTVTPLYVLAMSRTGWTAEDDSVVIDSPNVLTLHRYPQLGRDQIQLTSAFDIVDNRVGVGLTAEDGFAARVRQGVVDTNLEALLSADPITANTADAYALRRDWLTVTPARRGDLDGLPIGLSGRLVMLQDLDQGYVIVAPRTVDRARYGESVGWWRVDPATGDTLGVGSNGWGMGPEDSALFNMAVSAAHGFTFEYGLCQGFPAGINLLRYLNDQYFESWHPHWTTYNRSKPAQEVFDDNNVRCLISAIAMGVVATLPILLMTMSVRNMRAGLRLAEEVEAVEAQAKALEKYFDDLMDLPGLEGPPPVQVRTQVWRDTGYRDTMIPKPQPGWRADPAQILARENSIRLAEQEMNRAQQELNTSMREYLEYLNGRKPPQYGGRLLDPSYDPEVLEALRARAELDFGRYSDNVKRLAQLDPSRAGGWGGGGGGAPPPPQPIGNNNITQDAQVVGAAGASGALAK